MQLLEMKKMSVNERRTVLLNILSFFDKYCRQNGFHYSLACGTLLGAVRHKGFIPWDDDIDVYMLRSDYDKFKASYDAEQYTLQSYDKTGFPIPYSKLSDERTVNVEGNGLDSFDDIGISIDIFPIDGVSENLEEFQEQYLIKTELYVKCSAIMYNYSWKNVRSNLRKFYYKHVLHQNALDVCSQIEANAINTKYSDSSLVFEMIQGLRYKKPFKKEWFSDYTTLSFEGHQFSVIKGYDDYLKSCYGNYMELPPVDKRVSHQSVAYFKKKD